MTLGRTLKSPRKQKDGRADTEDQNQPIPQAPENSSFPFRDVAAEIQTATPLDLGDNSEPKESSSF